MTASVAVKTVLGAIAATLILNGCGEVQSTGQDGAVITPGADGGADLADAPPGANPDAQLPADAPLPQYFNVTVALTGAATGGVRDNSGAIDCGTMCVRSVLENTMVTLTASTTAGSVFAGWSIPGCRQQPECTITVTADMNLTAAFMEQPNYMFVTSLTYSGELGGLAGADGICQSLANEAEMPGSYVAWLSTGTIDAIDRLGSASGWIRPDGKPFANSKDDLANGRVIYPARIDNRGSDVESAHAWSATGWDGRYDAASGNCGSWTTTSGAARIGSTSNGDSRWTSTQGSSNCAGSQHLYCFGTDRQGWTTYAVTGNRKAFMTDTAFVPTSGIGGADALCQSQANNAGFSGSFKALMATAGASAASRFDTGGTAWELPDGALIAEIAAATFELTYLDAALNVTPDATDYLTHWGVWTGASSFYAAGTMDSTCNDWTTTAASAIAGSSGHTLVTSLLGTGSSSCNSQFRLMCLQE